MSVCQICIVIPCDSTEAWIVAAYDNTAKVEFIKDPWESVIAKRKTYHDIRISGKKREPAFSNNLLLLSVRIGNR